MASSRRVIYAALAGNLAIAVIKFIAAMASGSAAMAAEGIHSIIDCGNEVLLLVGLHRSRRSPDAEHPFGYGKTLYYYSLIVAIMIFMLGGGISILAGVRHIIDPPELSDPELAFAVLIASMLFEGTSWTIAWRQFRTVKGNRSVAEEIRRSKDPTSFAVLFEDTAAIAGLVVALILLASAYQWQLPILDGIASVLIGCILCTVSWLLGRETRSLLVGESADPAVRRSIEYLVSQDPAVDRVLRAMTMHLSPDEILLNLDIDFRKDLGPLGALEMAVDRIERTIRGHHPEVRYIFIEARSIASRIQPGDGEGKPAAGSAVNPGGQSES